MPNPSSEDQLERTRTAITDRESCECYENRAVLTEREWRVCKSSSDGAVERERPRQRSRGLRECGMDLFHVAGAAPLHRARRAHEEERRRRRSEPAPG